MYRDTAIDILLRRAGQRQGDTNLKEQLVAEMQLAQETMEWNGVPLPLEMGGGVFWPHFLVGELATNLTTENEPRMVLPSDFVMEYEDGALFRYDSDGKFHLLEKRDWDELRSRYSDEGTAAPRYYSLTGTYLYLFPIPDGEYTIRFLYYQRGAPLVENIENVWLKTASNLMISYVGTVMAGQILYDNNLRAAFQREYQQAALQLYYAEVAREQANFDAIKGM